MKAITITVDGQTKTLAEWADVIGVSRQALYLRLRRMPAERAVSLPPRPRRKHGECEICGGPHEAHGLCKLHYRRWIAAGKPQDRSAIRLARRKRQVACELCGAKHEAHGLCKLHLRRWEVLGRPADRSTVLDVGQMRWIRVRREDWDLLDRLASRRSTEIEVVVHTMCDRLRKNRERMRKRQGYRGAK